MIVKCIECDYYKERITKEGYYYKSEHRCEHPTCYEEVPDPIMGSVIKYTTTLYDWNKYNECAYFTPKPPKVSIWNKILYSWYRR